MMSGIPAYARRDIRRLLLDVVLLDGEQDAAPSLSDMARRSKALLDGPLKEQRRSKRRAAERSPRATGATKEAKRARANAETARLRAYADKRDPACVICGEPAPDPWELHHVDSGTGKTLRQSTTNTCKTHEGCHKRAHRGDTVALGMLAAWAYGHGYTDTLAIIERRILKVHEARAFATRTGGTP